MRRSNWTIFRGALWVAVLVALSLPTKPLLADTTLDSGTTTVSTGTNFGTNLYVADTGTATLVIAGGLATDTNGWIGNSAGSVGTATVSSGTWANSGELIVGEQGTGTLNVTGGSVTNTFGYLGADVGSVGIAFGWGRVKSTAKAKTSTGDAGSDTSLLINPMYADAVVRFDGLLRRAGVPFVPYVKGGLGIGMWQATGPSGTSAVGTVTGEGTTLGLHLGIGGALALNSFDRRTAMAMRHESGIDHAYLWGEWMLADLDGFGAKDAMHVGASAGVAGLAIED